MKYLNRFNEAQFNASEEEIKSNLQDLCLDLIDEGFSIDIYPPKYKNFYRWNISILFAPNLEVAEDFKLGDITDLDRVYDYMSDIGYIIDEVDSMEDFVNLKKLDLNLDINKWDKSQNCVLINLYFSKQTKLKLNESNEDDDEIINTLNDMSLDMRDERFDVDIKYKVYQPTGYVLFNKSKKLLTLNIEKSSFCYNDISFNINMIIEYLFDLGFEFYNIDFYNKSSYTINAKIVDNTLFNSWEEDISNYEIEMLQIIFRKKNI